MPDVKIGVQLYTLRDHIQNYEDTDKTLAYLEALGVNLVQISAIGEFEPEKVAEVFNKHNMTVCVTHKPFGRMENDLDNLIAEHKLLNCTNIGLGSMPDEYRGSLEALRVFIKKVTEIGKRMREQGCWFNYHNHSFEFNRLEDGRTLMDVLIEETDPDSFRFIPDTYWIHMGGVNESDFLKRLKGRVDVCHFKDWKVDSDGKPLITEIGNGNLDLDSCYVTCKELGIPFIVYEQDTNFAVNPLESAKLSYMNLERIAARNS